LDRGESMTPLAGRERAHLHDEGAALLGSARLLVMVVPRVDGGSPRML